MGNTTAYFRSEVLRKRPYLTEAICRRIIENPHKKVVQEDGRIRFWGRIEEAGKARFLRVVTLEDGQTIHNAFLDRGFKEELP
jgi:hypothetical protein